MGLVTLAPGCYDISYSCFDKKSFSTRRGTWGSPATAARTVKKPAWALKSKRTSAPARRAAKVTKPATKLLKSAGKVLSKLLEAEVSKPEAEVIKPEAEVIKPEAGVIKPRTPTDDLAKLAASLGISQETYERICFEELREGWKNLNAKLAHLQARLETAHDSADVARLNELIRKTHQKLSNIQMKQYDERNITSAEAAELFLPMV